MNIKSRVNRIQSTIDQLFEQQTGKIATENVVSVGNFSIDQFEIDLDITSQIYFGTPMFGNPAPSESDSLDYLDFCEKQLGIGETV